MMEKIWIDNKMYLVDEAVSEEIERLKTENSEFRDREELNKKAWLPEKLAQQAKEIKRLKDKTEQMYRLLLTAKCQTCGVLKTCEWCKQRKEVLLKGQDNEH